MKLLSSLDRRLLPALALGGLLGLAGAQAAPAGDAGPQLIGRLGKVAYYLVPPEQATDRAWYDRAIASVCEASESCFVRFYTNSQGVTPTLPLPEAIEREPTVMFQRSIKHGGQLFRWSCRLARSNNPADCF
ncbi:hypothetical protein JI742_05350 [Piscinibacter sp. Jin2]|uniref:DUF4189 domain-containing protein n=1 Tax=Aquariibacter lacus TaxID=2801332 RepID=A0A9X1BR87_9BURK|nr:hypothetical protein [Piscinibacter lacus]MBL0719313.1 hypothetical protein [Piscinibacter lacus]